MSNLSKEEILSTSRGWLASLLNFLPGLGSGYIYQRRWIAYSFTIFAVIAWFSLGIILQDGKEPTQNEQLIGISGLFLISIVTAIEANLTYKKVIKKILIKQEETKKTPKKGWFKN